MKRSLSLAAVLFASILSASVARAQMGAAVSGQVLDKDAKPFVGVTVTLTNVQGGQTYHTKTDKNGKFFFMNVTPGQGYYFDLDKPPELNNVHWPDPYEIKLEEVNEFTLNFKELIAKNTKTNPEEEKKRAEAQQKFTNMKQHFDAGVAAITQSKQLQAQLKITPPDQQAPIRSDLEKTVRTAITELQAAEQAAPPDDANLHVIEANLGTAYEQAGQYDDAVKAFQKATALKPTEPAYFNLLAMNLTQVGKIDEAGAACDKVNALNPQMTGSCWRNIGIVLQNASKMKDSVAPLRKATQVDPKNPDGWYFLGRGLLASMDYKQTSDKIEYIVQPGTADAFQQYLDLAPNGPYAAECKASLDQLKALGQGVQTKVNPRKKK